MRLVIDTKQMWKAVRNQSQRVKDAAVAAKVAYQGKSVDAERTTPVPPCSDLKAECSNCGVVRCSYHPKQVAERDEHLESMLNDANRDNAKPGE